MTTSEYSLHDVTVIKVEMNKGDTRTWLTVTVNHKDGGTSELTFWPVKDENIAIEFGGE
jgi:hypothetical protein